MRKVVLMMSVSLDGFVARPDGDLSWLFPHIDAEAGAWTLDAVRPTDTQLMGGVTYQEQEQYWPTATDELAPMINGADKIVFSSTLEKVEWENSRLATGTPAEEIAKVREKEGGDIFVPGGARLVQSLSKEGLIDVYKLRVHPVVLGAGLPLFTSEVDLRLTDSQTFGSGIVALTYERA
jgi:dihydrofolate reductase